LLEVVCGFLYYAQGVHNDHKDINILCFLSQSLFNGTNFTLQRRKILKFKKIDLRHYAILYKPES